MDSRGKIRWGLIGTTGWADHTFAPAIVSGGGTLVGAAGSTLERSEDFAKRHHTERAFSNVDDLLGHDAIDAVWVASPSDLHCGHAVRAVEAGKHVLVEKPMAPSVGDAMDMVKAARAHPGQLTAVGFQHRFNPAHRRLRALCRSGELGQLGFLRLHQFIPATEPPGEWRQDPGRSGGWAINDLGSHLLDLLRFLAGEIEELGSALSATRFQLAVDDTAVLLLRAGDATAVIDVSTCLSDDTSRIEVFATEGSALLLDSWPGGGVLETGDVAESFTPVDTYAAQVNAFSAAIGGAQWEGATWPDGLAIVRLVSQAYGQPLFQGAPRSPADQRKAGSET